MSAVALTMVTTQAKAQSNPYSNGVVQRRPSTTCPMKEDVWMPAGPQRVIIDNGDANGWTPVLSKDDDVRIEQLPGDDNPDSDNNTITLLTTQNEDGKRQRLVKFLVPTDYKMNRYGTWYGVENVKVYVSDKNIGANNSHMWTEIKMPLCTINTAANCGEGVFAPNIKDDLKGAPEALKQMNKAFASVVPIDYNHDGVGDFVLFVGGSIISINGKTFKAEFDNSLSLWKGKACRAFTWSACVGDFDGDGFDDIVAVVTMTEKGDDRDAFVRDGLQRKYGINMSYRLNREQVVVFLPKGNTHENKKIVARGVWTKMEQVVPEWDRRPTMTNLTECCAFYPQSSTKTPLLAIAQCTVRERRT